MTNALRDDANQSQAERIDQVCTRFEAAWQAGTPPRLEDWLGGIGEADRPALIKELLLLEVYYRSPGGEEVSVEEYRRRFPELEETWLHKVLASAQQEPANSNQFTWDAGTELNAKKGSDRLQPRNRRSFSPSAADVSTAASESIRYVGNYELREEIGRGGMGVVYRGHDAELNRTLAVKVLLEKHRDNEELKRRFLEEAQIMGQLQHPGVAPIHEIGQLADGRPFFSMKQIMGQTLSEMLKSRSQESGVRNQESGVRGQGPEVRGQESGVRSQENKLEVPVRGKSASAADHSPLATHHSPTDLPRLLGIFEQVCQTVAAAHSRGILHRDLKPQNVMVGAFGEVQVMDWGLAKRIADCSLQIADSKNSTQESLCENRQSGISNLQSTQAGRVLGTPAYMAPEQARGEVEKLDERCDVFGLGAILCELLTGRPPFPGDTQMDSHRKAMQCVLGETFARLDGCGADAELVQLARRCLAAEKENRPRTATEVAAAMADYQNGVAQRLQRAEIDRAQAQVKVAEECRRRRVWVALTAIVVVFAALTTWAVVWYFQDREERATADANRDKREALAEAERQAEQKRQKAKQAADRQQLEQNGEAILATVRPLQKALHRQLADAKEAAALLSDIDRWSGLVSKTRAIWKEADALVAGGKGLLEGSALPAQLAALDQQLRADKENLDRAKELDDIRLKAATLPGYDDEEIPAKEYPLFFQKIKQDVEKGNVDELAAQISQSPIRYALVAALDHWADVLPVESPLVNRLLDIARQADPDPWRNQVRDRKTWTNPPALMKLAKKAKLEEQTPQVILLLFYRINKLGHTAEAAALVRQALLAHPKDFWLHVALGNSLKDPGEQVGCYRAALAARPDSSAAYCNLGMALMRQNNLEEALACYEKALKIDPKHDRVHSNLAVVFARKNDFDRAITCLKEALKWNSNFALTHYNLGAALQKKGDWDGAIPCWEKAIALIEAQGHDPYNVAGKSHSSLGNALVHKNNLPAAISHCKKGLELYPMNAKAHFAMGGALTAQGNLKEAIPFFHQGLQISPNDPYGHWYLAKALRKQNDVKGAVAALRKALEFSSPYPDVFQGVGNELFTLGDLDGAIVAYRSHLKFYPKDVAVRMNLGIALTDMKDFPAAVAEYNWILERTPNHVDALINLGSALQHTKDFAGAIETYKKADSLKPNQAEIQTSLGTALLQQGEFREALDHLQKGQELGSKKPGWKARTEQYIKLCKRLLELDQKLSAFLKGKFQPQTGQEQAELAALCQKYKKYPLTAARLFSDAFRADPKLALDGWYLAVHASVVAAADPGKDPTQLKPGEPTQLRKQALFILKARLTALKAKLAKEAQAVAAVRHDLKEWYTDPDLVSVRDDKLLAKLPESEQRDWRQFWAEVEDLIGPKKK
jgi:serine/threonine protein kinase/Flp pilus assembly protein TadD